MIVHWYQQTLEVASPWLFSAALTLIAIGLLMRLPLEKELSWFWCLSRIRKFLVMVAVALFAYTVVPKGDGGNGDAPMRSPRMMQRQLPSAPESANDYYGMFPAWTNAVTNICCSGIKQADTSVFVRVHLPTGVSPAPTVIEVYAATSLETNVWSMIGTAPIVGGTDGTVIETPYSILPEGGAYRMFFKFGVNVDTDGDGLSDSYECIVSNTDPNHANADIDGDGIPNSGELELGTNPVSEDSDNDGIPDGDEVGYIVKSDTFVWYDTTGLFTQYSDLRSHTDMFGWMYTQLSSLILSDLRLMGSRLLRVIAAETGYVSFCDADYYSNWGYADGIGALNEDVLNPGSILVAPYWMNFSSLCYGDSDSYIRYGVVQDGSYVVEYHDVREAPYSPYGMTYQVIVPAGTGNVVKVSYLSSDIWMDGSNAVVGVQNKRIVTTNGFYNLTWDFAKLGPILPHTTIEYHLGYGTDPLREDTDDDGLDDYTEVFDAHSRPQFVDYDNDGLDDADEYGLGTDPNNRDSDSDGLTDGWEVARNLNPLSNDSDADGVSDSREVSLGTNPLSADTDGDGVSDGDELTGGTDPLRSDTDCDGLSDGAEIVAGTNPLQPDTDGDGMTDGSEVSVGTNPLQSDTDGDGMSDWWEVRHGFDPCLASDADGDADNDGLSNLEESQQGTDPHSADSDGDGLTDGVEVGLGTNPTIIDTDNDGLDDASEISAGTDPVCADTDDDGMPDGWEMQYGFNPRVAADANGDADNDGLSNLEESQYGADPLSADTDGDGVSDGDELTGGTDPLRSDTDCDGLSDGAEIVAGTDPLQPDTDGDGMTDGWESAHGYNPLVDNADDSDPDNNRNADPDHDGLDNGQECDLGTDPNDPDTDNDRVNDGAEKAQNSDPADGSDGGVANSRIAVSICFGDHSGSHSEKYRLVVTPTQGVGVQPSTQSRINANYGQCETNTVYLKPGWSYEVRLFHSGTKPGETTDYDYTLQVVGDLPANVILVDADSLLGVDETSSSFAGEGKVARLYLPKVDVEVDGVGENAEEAQGAYVPLVPDHVNVGEADWEDSLVPVTVRCWPKDMPTEVRVKIAADDLIYRRDGGVSLVPSDAEFGVEDVENMTFYLCGRTASVSYRNKSVVAMCGGVSDSAKYTVFACYYTAYVDQPSYGEGKKAYKWNWADGNVDVGHAFWEMRCRPVPTAVLDIAESPFLNTRVGFYGDGFHVPDNTHQPEVVKMLPISKAKFLSGLRFCEGFRASTPEYNLSDYNCCNATIDAAAACGISINRETQSWMFGGGLNPTSLGNDLMANNWQYIK